MFVNGGVECENEIRANTLLYNANGVDINELKPW